MSIVKEFVEKLIDRLEEEKEKGIYDSDSVISVKDAWRKSIKIVNQMAEEYNPSKSSSLAEQIADDLSAVLKEAKSMGCKDVKYFHHVPLENVETVIKALRTYKSNLSENLTGWIPCIGCESCEYKECEHYGKI